jgi:hypothetical protein
MKKSRLDTKHHLTDTDSRYWCNQADKLWSQIIHIENHCAVCGKIGKGLNAHHLLPKHYYRWLRHDLRNGILLCPFCHMFSGKSAAHMNSIWFCNWLMINRKEQWEWCLERLESKVEGSLNYYKEYERLRLEYKI